MTPTRHHSTLFALALVALAALLAACTSVPKPRVPGQVLESGQASWYGPGFHGKATASGEVYDMHDLTAAHNTLPFGTRVEVTNTTNGHRVVVRINDRGPFARGRIIDLSKAAAAAIGMIGPGTARVELRLVAEPEAQRWTVQAGAFRDLDRAQHLLQRLHAQFSDVCLVSEGGWHRVRVGEFADRGQAQQLLRRIRRAVGEGTLIPLP